MVTVHSLHLSFFKNLLSALIPDKVCLPYDKAELDSYLKELDTPEASISNTGSSLSVKDIESLPFGALSVDWRRLRLLSDLSTLPKPGIDVSVNLYRTRTIILIAFPGITDIRK